MAAFFFVLYAAGWTYGENLSPHDPLYLQATTACLTAIIVLQIANVFLCRSASRSLVATGLLGNRLITWGVILEVTLVLLIDYTSWGNLLLGTSPVAGAVWLFIIPFAAGLLALEELRKWLVRAGTNRRLETTRPERYSGALYSSARFHVESGSYSVKLSAMDAVSLPRFFS